MNLEQYKIIHLPKEQWKNVPIPMRYTTEQYYDVTDEVAQVAWMNREQLYEHNMFVETLEYFFTKVDKN